MAKLRASGVCEPLLKVIRSWLSGRQANVSVDGVLSQPFLLLDMVFQGTVLGPPFWNVFYGDAELAVASAGFTECVFADDLNSWKEFEGVATNPSIIAACHKCQSTLHEWGAANQVTFEATKESVHILDKCSPHGDDFKILSVLFDPKLAMYRAVQEFVREASWRLRALLRSSKFDSTAELFRWFKCHVVSFVDGAAPAIFHATDAVLAPLDGLQAEFLQSVEVSEDQALSDYNLAPACMRRDLSVLGLLYKIAHGKAPPVLCALFPPMTGNLERHGFGGGRLMHNRALRDTVEPGMHPMMHRSIFGMVCVF